MVGEEVKEENTHAIEFDIVSELRSLVETKIIPQQIADKLLKRLQENNVSLSKNQLYTLVDKINQIILSFKKNKDNADKNNNSKDRIIESKSNALLDEGSIADIHLLFEKIDHLQDQIEQLKEEKIPSLHSEKPHEEDESVTTSVSNQEDTIVTTEDIIVPDSNGFSTFAICTDPLTLIPNNPESIIVLMNWLQYLINQCGYKNLDTILEYYVDINWITDDVKMGLLDYSNGIKKEKMTSSVENKAKEEHTTLHSKDHIQSYMFIQKLKGKKFDKHFVDRIQNDLTRLRKKVV